MYLDIDISVKGNPWYTSRPCFLLFLGWKIISVVQNIQIKLITKPTKKQCSFKGPIDKISVDQEIVDSIASKSMYIEAGCSRLGIDEEWLKLF